MSHKWVQRASTASAGASYLAHIDSHEERNGTFRVSVTKASLGRSDRLTELEEAMIQQKAVIYHSVGPKNWLIVARLA